MQGRRNRLPPSKLASPQAKIALAQEITQNHHRTQITQKRRPPTPQPQKHSRSQRNGRERLEKPEQIHMPLPSLPIFIEFLNYAPIITELIAIDRPKPCDTHRP
jgi:hypothetical protein